jgi:DNA-directed RNA polymerase alpha subunit
MIFEERMPDQPQSEIPLGDLLPKGTTRVLAQNGITSVEAVREAYPDRLLRMRGLGELRFKQIETVLFPGQSYTPKRIYSLMRQTQGSSLSGILPPEIVKTLARSGVMTATQLVELGPKGLFKVKGLGPMKLREIERLFFPGQHYEVPRGRQPPPRLSEL